MRLSEDVCVVLCCFKTLLLSQTNEGRSRRSRRKHRVLWNSIAPPLPSWWSCSVVVLLCCCDVVVLWLLLCLCCFPTACVWRICSRVRACLLVYCAWMIMTWLSTQSHRPNEIKIKPRVIKIRTRDNNNSMQKKKKTHNNNKNNTNNKKNTTKR